MICASEFAQHHNTGSLPRALHGLKHVCSQGTSGEHSQNLEVAEVDKFLATVLDAAVPAARSMVCLAKAPGIQKPSGSWRSEGTRQGGARRNMPR